MSGYHLTPLARFDMREIWTYTVQQWGRRIADGYIRELTAAIEGVAADPYLGVAMDDGTHRKLIFRSHIIFYATSGNGVVVVRVLHQQMDVTNRLG
ncbi:type II toxin-antitoxin system RelE/ParE family toxin [Caulobacter sp. BP25]|uniref:type II toxin-antitoxin system RelE/ParE family toxin n=1 Tax=Caulobacter sp. BP25 TaxID=2048900 RepID=UPI000C129B0F|nr:type II toxin-antitoxin system RelE/ParE family toxin [Caulobacter sp. BP25]PHY18370.1 plasmid stabilization protein ParE [Caulobacter sp. BP25]